MRVRIVVTDGQGATFEGEAELAPVRGRSGAGSRSRTRAGTTSDAKVDFGLPLRAFLKQHAVGGGPRKFAVLVAHMTQGKTGVPVGREAMEREWTRNKGVLGGPFQDMYTTRSRENGWTDSPKRGTFVLRADWRGALKSNG